MGPGTGFGGLRYPRMGDQSQGASGSPYHGRLELTWTNKDQALLWSEDGSYRWVSPADYRVAEVRLLHDAGEVGQVGPVSRRAADNLLIRGDALNALTSLARIPEFQREYLGKVKLAYLDPPFNTQQALRAVRRRPGALRLADDDARPTRPDQTSTERGRIAVGALG